MRRVREAIGPDIKLMCDINQRWRPEQAIDIGRRVEDAGVGLFWLEDVTTADDFAGLARDHRRALDAGRRRRIRLGHRAVPPHDRGAIGRCRDDRPGAGRRHHAMDEGRRHGRGLQPAGRQPPDPGGACPPDRRDPERAHRRIHAVADASLRGGAAVAERRAGDADGPRSRAQIRPGRASAAIGSRDEDLEHPLADPGPARGGPARRHAGESECGAADRDRRNRHRRRYRGDRGDLLRRRDDEKPEARRRRPRRLDHRRGPAPGRGDRRQAARRGGRCRAGGSVHPGPGGDRHRALGHPRQGAEPAAVEIARRRAPAGPDLCQRRLAAQPDRSTRPWPRPAG